jgi:transposase
VKARGVKLGRTPKLIEHQRREAIRRRDRDGESMREIARRFNFSHSTISSWANSFFEAGGRVIRGQTAIMVKPCCRIVALTCGLL